FIKPIFDTLDIYHNQEVDPRAIAISWKQLVENNPDAKLEFASMEIKGENQDHLLLRLKAEANADLSQLSADYFETYNQIKALTAAEYKELIAAKDNRIQALENMVDTALKRPGFYAETYNHQGDKIISGEQCKINLKDGNYNEQIEGNYVQDNYRLTKAVI
ncbi:MAG: pentapeptide repeat-containing protein, partial [Cyanobacteria bacterium P01_C01_bin.72]